MLQVKLTDKPYELESSLTNKPYYFEMYLKNSNNTFYNVFDYTFDNTFNPS